VLRRLGEGGLGEELVLLDVAQHCVRHHVPHRQTATEQQPDNSRRDRVRKKLWHHIDLRSVSEEEIVVEDQAVAADVLSIEADEPKVAEHFRAPWPKFGVDERIQEIRAADEPQCNRTMFLRQCGIDEGLVRVQHIDCLHPIGLFGFPGRHRKPRRVLHCRLAHPNAMVRRGEMWFADPVAIRDR